MRGCHNCEHAARIAAGEFEETPWEEVPCSTCDVMSGAGFAIEYDDEIGGEVRTAIERDPTPLSELRRARRREEDDVLPVAVMREAMVGFLTLPAELRDVVAWRYAGMKYGDIAQVQGVSLSCAEKRHRRALALWPTLRALFPEKNAKHEKRMKGTEGRMEGRKGHKGV